MSAKDDAYSASADPLRIITSAGIKAVYTAVQPRSARKVTKNENSSVTLQSFALVGWSSTHLQVIFEPMPRKRTAGLTDQSSSEDENSGSFSGILHPEKDWLGDLRYGRARVMSPKELAREFEMSESRLADLRSQRKGPPFFKFNGIWYPKEDFDLWVEMQMRKERDEDVAEEEERQVALPVRIQGPRVHGQHRFGRHITRQERSSADRSSGSDRTEEGDAADSED